MMHWIRTTKEIYAFPTEIVSVWYRRKRWARRRVEVVFKDGSMGFLSVGSDPEGEFIVKNIVDAVRDGTTILDLDTTLAFS